MTHARLTAAALALSCGLAGAQPIATAPTSGGILLSASDLQALRGDQNRFASILKGCDGNLNYQAKPPASLQAPPHYTTSGATKPTSQAQVLPNDAHTAYRLGLCYALTGEGKYAATTQKILDAWATTFKKVGSHQSQGNVNFNLPYMVIAAGWVKDAGGWNHKRFDRFLRRTILPMAELKNVNNHGQWAIFMQSTIGAYLNDPAILGAAQINWEKHVQGAVAADGTMPHEIARSDTNNFIGGPTKGVRGLAYTHYALLPATLTAQVLDVAGKPVWNTPSGKLLQKAFGKAAGWTLHPETFPYYASNGGKLQDTNGVGYFPVLLRHYPSADAQAVLKAGNVTADGFLLMKLFGGQ